MKHVSADFPPLFGPQVPLKICFGSMWTAFQEVSLNHSTDTFRFKRIYVLQDLKANYDSSACGTKRTLLSGKSSFLQHNCFLGSFCVPPLPSGWLPLHLWEELPEPLQASTCVHFLLRSRFLVPVTFLLCGASSSQLIWLPDPASQEDRHS